MQLIACIAFARAMDLRRASHRETVRLTPRERETLAWISAGKSDWEISVIFGVAERAVTKHADNIRTKLGAVNRAHAVAEAFRRGLLG